MITAWEIVIDSNKCPYMTCSHTCGFSGDETDNPLCDSEICPILFQEAS